MTTTQKVGYCFSGFVLSVFTLLVTAIALQLLVDLIWAPLSGLLYSYASRLAVVIMAVASTVISLLWLIRNEQMKRGVWCFMYTLTATSVIGLAVCLFL